MHIEPGVVDGAKIVLSYGTAAAAAGYTAKLALTDLRAHSVPSFAIRSLVAFASVFTFFQILPHFPVGVSEVHFILGSTLLLILGAAPAALGLALGLLLQGLFFAPGDLPQYFINVTTLLVPLFTISAVAKASLPRDKAYVDLRYADVLKLSVIFQGGVVAWVAFWAFFGQGFSSATMTSVGTFGIAYMTVILIEPLADLAILAAAKSLRGFRHSGLLTHRLYNPG